MVLTPAELKSLRLRPLRRAEFDRLVKLGAFDEERVELLYGMLVPMVPQSSEHAGVSALVARVLREQLGGRAEVRNHAPIIAADESEPEPDVAVVPPGNYIRSHPSTVWLVVEVSRSSKVKDRGIKSRLYAQTGIPEYWIVDEKRGEIEVRTQPVRGKYTRRGVRRRGERIRLVHFPDVQLPVSELVPT